MEELDLVLKKMEVLESGLQTLEMLFAAGAIVPLPDGKNRVGDWDMKIWEHSVDNGFSVAAIERARQTGAPFPCVVHRQKKWILCSQGEIKVVCGSEVRILNEGQRMTVPPDTAHKIVPATAKCSAVLITIPADPGMRRNE